MKIRIPSQQLHAFLSLSWTCTEVGDGWCAVEHSAHEPPMACFECGDACRFHEWVQYGSECQDCHEGMEMEWLH
jgi:hypothetical protein